MNDAINTIATVIGSLVSIYFLGLFIWDKKKQRKIKKFLKEIT